MDTKRMFELSDKHLMTFTKRSPVALVRGEGSRVWDSNGKEYLDFTGGIAVTALGHSHPKVVGTLREQAATLVHVSNYFHIPQQAQLAQLLCEHSFADRVFFSNSGAEANETAIKLARKWAKEHGSSDRGDIISMRGGFQGGPWRPSRPRRRRSITTASSRFRGASSTSRSDDLKALERAIDSRTAAVLVEPIQGEGGVIFPTTAICPGCARSVTRRASPSSSTRSRRAWGAPASSAHEHCGGRARHHDGGQGTRPPMACRWAPRSPPRTWRGLHAGQHGETFGGNPFATAVGVTVFTTLLEERLPSNAPRAGRKLCWTVLRAVQTKHPQTVGEVSGRGLLVAMDQMMRRWVTWCRPCRERGLLVLTAGDNALRLAPALVVEAPRSTGAWRSSIAALKACRRREATSCRSGTSTGARPAPVRADRRSQGQAKARRPGHAALRPDDRPHLREAVAPDAGHLRGGHDAAGGGGRLPRQRARSGWARASPCRTSRATCRAGWTW